MSFIEDLNISIEKYCSDLLYSYEFEKVEEFYQGMGALKKFENKNLKIQIVNDRGLINLDISSKYGDENYRDVELIKSLIELDALSNEKIGKWERNKILNQNLDLISQCNFIIENIETLAKLFDRKNYKKTIKKIDKVGFERSHKLFE
ncbi:hypothetical protein [uncultured Draconibacterium sp.]|uniref:hypothetical protein n=1 Tax=uncultured Draconibacterium sp. TaxID=1573823 RepID=UPI0029C7252E|nr:hypothetical protein [uncultured Draconibacterium sp.]